MTRPRQNNQQKLLDLLGQYCEPRKQELAYNSRSGDVEEFSRLQQSAEQAISELSQQKIQETWQALIQYADQHTGGLWEEIGSNAKEKFEQTLKTLQQPEVSHDPTQRRALLKEMQHLKPEKTLQQSEASHDPAQRRALLKEMQHLKPDPAIPLPEASRRRPPSEQEKRQQALRQALSMKTEEVTIPLKEAEKKVAHYERQLYSFLKALEPANHSQKLLDNIEQTTQKIEQELKIIQQAMENKKDFSSIMLLKDKSHTCIQDDIGRIRDKLTAAREAKQARQEKREGALADPQEESEARKPKR